MMAWSRHRVPPLLRERIPCDVEEFVARHCPSGPRRDAMRWLWRFLGEAASIELSGLHPDDDLASVIGDDSMGYLDVLEVVAALQEECGAAPLIGADTYIGSFRHYIERIVRGAL